MIINLCRCDHAERRHLEGEGMCNVTGCACSGYDEPYKTAKQIGKADLNRSPLAAPRETRVLRDLEVVAISLDSAPSVFPGASLTARELTQPKGWVDPYPETVSYPQADPQVVDEPKEVEEPAGVALSDAAADEIVEVLVAHGEQPEPVTIPTEWEWDEESRDWVDPANVVPRHREPARVARNRAHHRAQAELCRNHPEEFEELKNKHLERAKQEQILLAGRILRPGERRAGESVLDRVKAEE